MPVRERFVRKKKVERPDPVWPVNWTNEELAIYLDMAASVIKSNKPQYFKDGKTASISALGALVVRTEHAAFLEAARRLREAPATTPPATPT